MPGLSGLPVQLIPHDSNHNIKKMIICIAGKHSCSVKAARHIDENYPAVDLRVLPNRDDDGLDTWQPSLRAWARRARVQETTLEELYLQKELIFVSIEYDRLITPQRFASQALYNIHFSLLPEYKGSYCSVWPILDGKKNAGITLHRIDPGIDTGDIIAQVDFPIGSDDTSRDVYQRFLDACMDLFPLWLPRLLAGSVEARPQPAQGSTFRSRKSIDYSSLSIELKQTAENIRNQVRAFAFPEYQMPKVHGRPVRRVEILNQRSFERPGTLLHENLESITIATVDFDVRLMKDELSLLLEACRNGNVDHMDYYVERVASLESRSREGWTPLILASYHGHSALVGKLLRAGASPQTPNYKGTTPLMYAMSPAAERGIFDPLRMLIASGADVDAHDAHGRSALSYANERGWLSVVELLMKSQTKH